MGSLGWAPDEVDRMELWQVARFLGVGGGDPVIRGSRGLSLRSDDDTAPAAAGRESAGEIDEATWGMTGSDIDAFERALR